MRYSDIIDQPRPVDRDRPLADFRQKQTGTPEFRRWFKRSVVVNQDGSPMVVYHGTKQNFAAFDRSVTQFGIHIGTLLQAHDFVHDEAGQIMPVYLSLQNPIRLPDMTDWVYRDVIRELHKQQISVQQIWPNPDKLYTRDETKALQQRQLTAIIEALESEGYDGIVYFNTHEGSADADSWIVFHSSQIKSAIGNTGLFNADEPSLTEAANPTGTIIVDDDGNPLVVHHFTYNDFVEFDRLWAARYFGRDPEGIDTVGLWFTDNPKARYVSAEMGGKRMDVTLNMHRPAYIDDEQMDAGGQGDAWDQLQRMVKDAGGSTALRNKLKSEGYDGIVLSGTVLDRVRQNVIIAFDPAQIQHVKTQFLADK